MTFENLVKNIRQGKFSSLYLITGEEDFLVEEALRLLRSQIMTSSEAFDYQVFSAETSPPEEILSSAQTLPLLSSRRLIIVKDLDKTLSASLDRFLPYLSDPSPSTCLVFVAKKQDKRKRFFQAFSERGEIVTCSRPSGAHVSGWIKNRMKERGLSISDEAIFSLLSRSDADLWRLTNELEKAALSLRGASKEITADEIEEVLGGGRAATIFHLTDAIGDKKKEKALILLSSLLDEGEPPLVILSLLTRHFRLMWAAREMKDAGRHPRETSDTLGIPDRYLSSYLRQADGFTQDEFRSSWRLFMKVDLDLKTGRRPPHILLESLILTLCGNLMNEAGETRNPPGSRISMDDALRRRFVQS